jgi:hypothetical protein
MRNDQEKMLKTLFYFCHRAYLVGDEQNARMYFDMLREEYKIRSVAESLSKYQLQILKDIREALKTGKIVAKKWSDQVAADTAPEGTKPPVESQAQLVKFIHDKGKSQLESILQESVHLYNIEQPCGPYGYVDMVYAGDRSMYPVEVKKSVAGHDVVGQIGKYDLWHKLRLHYGQYDRVQSAVIARGYDKYAIEELRRMGVLPLTYSIEGKNLSIRAV